MNSYSTSFTVGKASDPHGANIEHNNRIFVAKNVDEKKISDNIIYVREDLKKAYDKLFGESLKEYNAKQKKPCRRIDSYYTHIKNSKREELFYEMVVQFGDRDTAKIGTDNAEEVKKMLDEYMRNFEKRNPNLHVFNAVLHMDEATPHLHIDVIPFYTKPRERFLSKGVSMYAALIEQGCIPKNSHQNQLVIWEQKEREEMKKILENRGLVHENKNVKHAHLSVEDYKLVQDALKKAKHGFRMLTPEELAAENAQKLKSQIAVLEGEVVKLEEQKKSPLKNFYYSSDEKGEEKCAYVKAKLDEIGAAYFETENGFSAQEYLIEDIREFEKQFKPAANSKHEKLRADIDKILMQSKSTGAATAFDDFLARMKAAGYEIKQGKYLAAKPKFSTQFVRLKSLGENYSEQALRNRVAAKGKYENALEEKIKNKKSDGQPLTDFEILVLKTCRQYIFVFAKDALPAKPKNSAKHFSWENCAELERLVAFSRVFKGKNFSLENLREKFSEAEKAVSDGEEKIAALKKELEFFGGLYAKAKLCFENSPPKNMPKNTAEKRAFDEALKILSAHKITKENYKIIERTAEKNRAEIAETEKTLAPKREELKELSENLTAAEEIFGETYVQKLVSAELERRRAEWRKME
jgi:hypothetical protein